MNNSFITRCSICEQKFNYKMINLYYNSICPSCLEKNPDIRKKINEAFEEYGKTVDEASRIYDDADGRADIVLNDKLTFILDRAK